MDRASLSKLAMPTSQRFHLAPSDPEQTPRRTTSIHAAWIKIACESNELLVLRFHETTRIHAASPIL